MDTAEGRGCDDSDAAGSAIAVPTAVRAETPADFAAIRAVNVEAFGQTEEANLVEQLRDDDELVASLVAERGGCVVGHVVFSRLRITAVDRVVSAAALAPVAVRPPFQRQGVGSMLIRAGLRRCGGLGIEAVVVLGHPAYYPRFGFSAALAGVLRAPFSGSAFMALNLVPNALDGGGSVHYTAAFGV